MVGHVAGVGLAGILGALTTLALLVLLVCVVVLVIRGATRGGTPPPGPSAEQILAERFARGEIDAEEYQQRLRTLRGQNR
ncbi:MAG TPA: SHOCT domain-containing protein [Micromonosporaceae bacterium]|jgi:putative membrane protein